MEVWEDLSPNDTLFSHCLGLVDKSVLMGRCGSVEDSVRDLSLFRDVPCA